MLRSRALRSGVRVSTPDGAAGSRLPALLALPHPQLFLRTIFARGSLWAWRFGKLQRARDTDTRERLIADKKEAGGVRIASDSRGGAEEGQAPAGAKPPPAASGACLRRPGGRAEA